MQPFRKDGEVDFDKMMASVSSTFTPYVEYIKESGDLRIFIKDKSNIAHKLTDDIDIYEAEDGEICGLYINNIEAIIKAGKDNDKMA